MHRLVDEGCLVPAETVTCRRIDNPSSQCIFLALKRRML
jgi:hypothetical protein